LMAMLKSFKRFLCSRQVVITAVAALLAFSILLAIAAPFPAGSIDWLSFELPVLFFVLALPVEDEFSSVPSTEILPFAEPSLAASYGRAPPA